MTPSLGVAQLQFKWSDDAPLPARYVSVEQCIAGVNRIVRRAIIEQNKSIRIDTMPLHFDNQTLHSQPQDLTAFASGCVDKYDVKSFRLKDGWDLLARINRSANKTDQFEILFKRRIDTVPLVDSVQYAGVMDTIVMILQSSNRRDLELADSFLRVRHSYPASTPANAFAISLNLNQLHLSRNADRRDLSEAAANRVVKLNEKLNGSDRATSAFRRIRADILRAYSFADWIKLTSMLASNVDSYLNNRLKQWETVTRGTAQFSSFPIGKTASRIPSDETFQNPWGTATARHASAKSSTDPTLNALSLVVFLGHECYMGAQIGLPFGKANGYDCPRTVSVLKRLHARFPELRIVVAVETHGYFSFLGPLKEREEAEWLRKWIHDYMNTPADLIVTHIPYFFLPAPDERRVEETLHHITDYAFGRKDLKTGRDWVVPQTAFLINSDGRILHSDRLVAGRSMFSEQEFSDLIEAALIAPKDSNVVFASVVEPKVAKPTLPSETITEITDDTVGQFTLLVEQLVAAIGNDPAKREVVAKKLYSWLIAASSRLPGEKDFEQFDDLPEIQNIIKKGFGNTSGGIVRSLGRILTAYSYVDLEKKGNIDQAKANAFRSSVQLSPEEYEVMRKYYDRLTAALTQLMPRI